jgi:hypothetical protein
VKRDAARGEAIEVRRLRERMAGGAQDARVVLVGHDDQQVLGGEHGSD